MPGLGKSFLTEVERKVKFNSIDNRLRIAGQPKSPSPACGFDTSTWCGVCALTGTPKVIVNKSAVKIAEALQRPAVRERLAALGAGTVGNMLEEFAAYCQSKLAKWSKIVRES